MNDIQNAFGTVNNPISSVPSDAPAGLAAIIGFGVRGFIFIAMLALLLYLLWGAMDWITSGGEKEKISKAQNKIQNAVIGMLLVIGALSIFDVVTNNILHLQTGWSFVLPQLK